VKRTRSPRLPTLPNTQPGYQNPFLPLFPAPSFRDEGRVAQPLPYMALKDAPVQIRRAATVAQISISITRALSILFTTLIIATLPTWVPGLLTYQTTPVTLLVLAIGSAIVSHKGSGIREEIAERKFKKARSSTFSTAFLGFIIGGIIPGLLYIYLWTFAGFLGGLIAGGKIRRGFLVGMTVYLSTLGALGLAALAIYQNVNLSTLSSLPPPPPRFSIISATTGPVAGDIIPLLIQT